MHIEYKELQVSKYRLVCDKKELKVVMTSLQDLISKIEDSDLQKRISDEVKKLTDSKNYGLVFERHLPECIPLYDFPIRRGMKVALKNGYIDNLYIVVEIKEDTALCRKIRSDEERTFNIDEIVVVAEFGEPIYPYLKPVDSISTAPGDDLWHILIEADNYHALQLLAYLYAGKVDCIYIDPPYNTGAHDWKYNNNYVDEADSYHHSKWLSMMEKRLKIAEKLLNPDGSVLIVTADEHEFLHLGCLLEDLFPQANIQMVSSIINRHGSMRPTEFTRVNEYIFYVRIGDAIVGRMPSQNEDKSIQWHSLLRGGRSRGNFRYGRERLFYPIYVNTATDKIEKVGEYIPLSTSISDIEDREGCVTIWPLRSNGDEGCWALSSESLQEYIEKGYCKVGKSKYRGIPKYTISYLQEGTIDDIEAGTIEILGNNPDGSIIGHYVGSSYRMQVNQWDIKSHDASEYGTKLLDSLIGSRFSYPKSLYAVMDCISYATNGNKDAFILDFFAGSGTTLHAVNLMNAEDGGLRRCILVTNNEVSEEEAKSLKREGHHPGDDEWEKYGIARYVAWPRTRCSISGCNIGGNPLRGEYLDSDIHMSDGFKSNVAYYKLGFLDKTRVELRTQFANLLPVLWMKAGAIGECPSMDSDELPEMMILTQNKFAVLLDESKFQNFKSMILENVDDIRMIYFVTDSEAAFVNMSGEFSDKIDKIQLYSDYLENFRINIGDKT